MTLKKRLAQLEATKAAAETVDMIVYNICWKDTDDRGEPTVIGRLAQVPPPSGGPWVWLSQGGDETDEEFEARCRDVKTGVIDPATLPAVDFRDKPNQMLCGMDPRG